MKISNGTAFTLKLRESSSAAWTWWAKEHRRAQDEILMLKTALPLKTDDLSNYLGPLDPMLKASKAQSQVPYTSLWAIEAPVDGALYWESSSRTTRLGCPWDKTGFLR